LNSGRNSSLFDKSVTTDNPKIKKLKKMSSSYLRYQQSIDGKSKKQVKPINISKKLSKRSLKYDSPKSKLKKLIEESSTPDKSNCRRSDPMSEEKKLLSLPMQLETVDHHALTLPYKVTKSLFQMTEWLTEQEMEEAKQYSQIYYINLDSRAIEKKMKEAVNMD